MTNDVNTAADQLFTPKTAAYVKDLYSKALLQAPAAGMRDIGGGVADFHCDSIERSSSAIVVHATATTWARQGNVLPDGSLQYSTPSSAEHVTYTFSLDAAGRPDKISDYTSDFTA